MEGLRLQWGKEQLMGPASWHLEEQAGEEAWPLPSHPQSPPPALCRASTSSWGHIHIWEVTSSHKHPPLGVKCLLPTHKGCSQESTNDFYLPLRPNHCFQVTECVSLEVNAQQHWLLLEELEPLVCQWERIWEGWGVAAFLKSHVHCLHVLPSA